MSYSAGGIEYKVDVDTSDLINASNEIQRKLMDANVAFARAEKNVAAFKKEVASAGNTVGANNVVFDRLGNIVEEDTAKLTLLSTEMRRLGTESRKAAAMVDGAVGANQNASGVSKDMAANLQQAGYQVGDFAVQVASGQSAITAFTQQASQLLGTFGGFRGAIAGAVLAVGGAIAVSLLPSLMKSSATTREVSDKTKDLNEKYSLTTEQIRNMVQANNDEIAVRQKSITEMEKERKKLLELAEGRKIAKSSFVAEAFKATGLPGTQLIDTKDIQSDAVRDARLEYERITAEIKNAQTEIKKFRDDSEKITNVSEEQRELQKSLNEALQLQNALINGGELAAKKLAAAFQLDLKAGEKLPKPIEDAVVKLHDAEQVAKRIGKPLAEALYEQQSEQKNLTAQIDGSTYAMAEYKAAAELGFGAAKNEIYKLALEIKKTLDLTGELARKMKAKEFVESGKYQDPINKLDKQYNEELKMLDDYLAKNESFRAEHSVRVHNMTIEYERNRAKALGGTYITDAIRAEEKAFAGVAMQMQKSTSAMAMFEAAVVLGTEASAEQIGKLSSMIERRLNLEKELERIEGARRSFESGEFDLPLDKLEKQHAERRKMLDAELEYGLRSRESYNQSVAAMDEELARDRAQALGGEYIVDALEKEEIAFQKIRAEIDGSTEAMARFEATTRLGANASAEEIDALTEAIKRNMDAKIEADKVDEAKKFVESGAYGGFLEELEKEKAREQELLDIARENNLIAEEEYLKRLNMMRRSYALEAATYQAQQYDDMLTEIGNINGEIGKVLKDAKKEHTLAAKAAFYTEKAISMAQAIINAELGATQALAMGPAGIPLAATIRASGYISAGIIAGQAIAGGRQYGGPVSAGNMYRVNETGVPEIVTAGGKDYMTMGSTGGKVTPLDKAGLGGGGITINNYGSPDLVEATQTDRGWVIDIARREAQRAAKGAINEVANQFSSGRGNVVSAASQNGNYKTRAGYGRG